MKKVAIILFNLGGPTDLKAVKPFLFNLFKDKAIINLPFFLRYPLATFISSKRQKTAQEIYSHIGGKSPLLEITNAQSEALEKELSFGNIEYKSFVCMRYWHPMSKEVALKVKEYEPDEIIMLPLYPQFSTTTTASSFQDFEKALKKQKVSAKLKYVCCYPENEQFIFAHSRLIQKAIEKVQYKKYDYRLLFSAHGLPQSVVDGGDPYAFQIELSTKAIIKELEKKLKLKKGEKIDYKICYQSKVGPMKWLSPSLDTEINRAALDKKAIIIIPIAFVSDHSETLVELDIEYKEMAKKAKIPYYFRVDALNDDGYFIKALADICKKAAKNENDNKEISNCSVKCQSNFKKCFRDSF